MPAGVVPAIEIEQVVDREVAVSQPDHRLIAAARRRRRSDLVVGQGDDLVDGGGRDRQRDRSASDDDRVDDRQRQWQPQREGRPAAKNAVNLDRSAERTDAAANHVHADAAAGDGRGLLRGAEAGPKDQVVDFAVGGFCRPIGRDQTPVDGPVRDGVPVQTAAVVADRDEDLVTLVGCRDGDASRRGFADVPSRLRVFDAVIQGVADQV